MSKWKQRVDPACGKATELLLTTEKLTKAELARILQCDASEIRRAANGYRPFARVLARLYILTGDHAFAPKNENEIKKLEEEERSPLQGLKNRLEPDPEVKACEKGEVRDKLFMVLNILGEILDVDEDLLKKLINDFLSISKPAEVIESPWFDRIMCGMAEIRGQQLGGVRFVLSESSFRALEGTFTPAEVQDTRLLIQELRRRINIVNQLTDKAARAKVLKKLAPEIRELYLAIEHSKDADPSGTAERISQLRKLTHLKSGER